jgi:general secretion pathway protein M
MAITLPTGTLPTGTLPTGPKGRALALGMTAVVIVTAWLGIVAPVLDWFADRDETLRRQAALAHRMEALVATLPALRETAAGTGDNKQQPGALLAGATDPLAAAALQQKLDELAAAAGVRIGSEEILPAQTAGDLRAVAVRVTLTAPWRELVALLEGMAKADVPMMADEMQLRGPPVNAKLPELPVDARFTVTSYRAPGAEAR